MINYRETNLTAQRQKERNLVRDENVECQENVLVTLQQNGWNFNKVFCHWLELVPGGLSFQRRNILPPDLDCVVNILLGPTRDSP
jgi:hypothetical protein